MGEQLINLGQDINPETGGVIKEEPVTSAISEVQRLSESELNSEDTQTISEILGEIAKLPDNGVVNLYHSCGIMDYGGGIGSALQIARSVETGVRQNKTSSREGPMDNPTFGIVPMRFWGLPETGGFKYSIPRKEIALPGEDKTNKRIMISEDGIAGIIGPKEESYLSLLEVEGKIIVGPYSKPTQEQIDQIREVNDWTAEARKRLKPYIDEINNLTSEIGSISRIITLHAILDGSFEEEVNRKLSSLRQQQEINKETIMRKTQERKAEIEKLNKYLIALNNEPVDINFLQQLNIEIYFGLRELDEQYRRELFIDTAKKDLQNQLNDIQATEPTINETEELIAMTQLQTLLTLCEQLKSEYKKIYTVEENSEKKDIPI